MQYPGYLVVEYIKKSEKLSEILGTCVTLWCRCCQSLSHRSFALSFCGAMPTSSRRAKPTAASPFFTRSPFFSEERGVGSDALFSAAALDASPAHAARSPAPAGSACPSSPQSLGSCPRCAAALRACNGRYGPFVGCSAFPRCRYIVPRPGEPSFARAANKRALSGGSKGGGSNGAKKGGSTAAALYVRIEMESAESVRVWSSQPAPQQATQPQQTVKTILFPFYFEPHTCFSRPFSPCSLTWPTCPRFPAHLTHVSLESQVSQEPSSLQTV